MSFSHRVVIVSAVVVVSLTAPAFAGAGSCTHPLFVNPKYAAGIEPLSVVVGDLDGVNGPDLAVGSFETDHVLVLLHNGDGTFAAAVAYASGT